MVFTYIYTNSSRSSNGSFSCVEISFVFRRVEWVGRVFFAFSSSRKIECEVEVFIRKDSLKLDVCCLPHSKKLWFGLRDVSEVGMWRCLRRIFSFFESLSLSLTLGNWVFWVKAERKVAQHEIIFCAKVFFFFLFKRRAKVERKNAQVNWFVENGIKIGIEHIFSSFETWTFFLHLPWRPFYTTLPIFPTLTLQFSFLFRNKAITVFDSIGLP